MVSLGLLKRYMLITDCVYLSTMQHKTMNSHHSHKTSFEKIIQHITSNNLKVNASDSLLVAELLSNLLCSAK